MPLVSEDTSGKFAFCIHSIYWWSTLNVFVASNYFIIRVWKLGIEWLACWTKGCATINGTGMLYCHRRRRKTLLYPHVEVDFDAAIFFSHHWHPKALNGILAPIKAFHCRLVPPRLASRLHRHIEIKSRHRRRREVKRSYRIIDIMWFPCVIFWAYNLQNASRKVLHQRGFLCGKPFVLQLKD